MFGHHLAVIHPHEEIAQRELGPGVFERAAGTQELGKCRSEARSFRPPKAVNQQGILGRSKRADQCPQLVARHPEARRHCNINMRRAGGAGRRQFCLIPRFRKVLASQVEHGLDLMLAQGLRQRRRRHLPRPIDPSLLDDAEVVSRLVPDHEECDRDRDGPNQPRRQDSNPPRPRSWRHCRPRAPRAGLEPQRIDVFWRTHR